MTQVSSDMSPDGSYAIRKYAMGPLIGRARSRRAFDAIRVGRWSATCICGFITWGNTRIIAARGIASHYRVHAA